MPQRPPVPSVAAFAAALIAAAAPSAGAQVIERETRTFVVPPPSAESTGGAPVEPIAPLHGSPRLRGFKLESRDAMHPEEISLVGLEQSEKPYRPDLELDHSPLGGAAKAADEEDDELYQRQLAIFSGERATAPSDDEPAEREPSAAEKPVKGVVRDAPNPWTRWWPALASALACAALVIWKRRDKKRS